MESEKIRTYIELLNDYTNAYEVGAPLISDKEWDDLYFKLQKLEKETGIIYPDSPTQHIQYSAESELKKVTHNHPMLSAAKTKDWDEFLNYFSSINPTKDVIGMLKMDGLTLSLRYLNGYLVSAETRGNGEVGEDVTHNAKVVKSIPQEIPYKDELIIDGEIICKTDDFEPFSSEYKNPRNFAAGSIRLLDSKECAKRNLTFVVWYIEKGLEGNSLLDKFRESTNLGFIVVPYTSSFDMDAKEYLENVAKIYHYPIDGLVGRFDDISFGESLGETSHHKKSLFAFKFYDETVETQLKYIDYTMSRNGTLTPVAVFDPVELEGSVVSRASLHNLSIMEDIMGSCCYAGQKIEIFKANEIIPQVKSAVKMTYKEVIANGSVSVDHLGEDFICPVCGGATSITTSDSGTRILVCDNPQCSGKLIQRVDHFCSKKGIDIKGLSLATLNKVYDWGWLKTIKDIYNLKNHRTEWQNKDGFGPASVNKILQAIEESKKCYLYQFIAALGIPLVGATVAREICKYYTTWDNFRKAVGSTWSNLDGFGPEMEWELNHFNYDEADKIAEMLDFKQPEAQTKETLSKNAAGLNFAVTGKINHWKNRDALKAYIESIGGKVTGSISSKTNYLINNDADSASSKNQKAKILGIPVVSEAEFIDIFGQD
jgi:DNA ligase (NAD+)